MSSQHDALKDPNTAATIAQYVQWEKDLLTLLDTNFNEYTIKRTIKEGVRRKMWKQLQHRKLVLK